MRKESTNKYIVLGYQYPIVSFDIGANKDIDQGCLIKLFNQLNVFPRFLNAFNYPSLNLDETPKILELCCTEFQNFLDKE